MNELKICVNVPVENDTCNMRTFEAAIAGIPLLIQMKDKNGFDEVFNNDMYLAFEEEKDFKEKLVRLVASKELRDSMAKKAREHALTFHTYRSRLNTIFGTLNFPLLKNYA
jgi:spore maturation protein CgeB